MGLVSNNEKVTTLLNNDEELNLVLGASTALKGTQMRLAVLKIDDNKLLGAKSETMPIWLSLNLDPRFKYNLS